MLFSKSQDKVKEYIGTETETKYSSQNPTEYSSANFEPTLWMLGLISLSGLVVNLKKKTIAIGGHYPLDLVGGILLGVGVSLIFIGADGRMESLMTPIVKKIIKI